ncbi:MAG: FliM/FliN family flagellar motor switch protein [Bryobacteraceae bacterium]|nr:FliM/FliN family flagellar motor switch protein [Bryobacteraceae bacterium]
MQPGIFSDLEHLGDVQLLLTATIPCLELTVGELLALDTGSIVPTARAAGESVDINVGGQMVSQGELIVIENSLAARFSDFGEKI